MTQPSIPKGIIAPDIGERFLGKPQRLGRVDRGSRGSLAVDQAVQDVEYVGLGCNAGFQRQFDCTQHGLLVMLQHERQDLSHLSVSARAAQEPALKLPERIGHLSERSTIAQGSGLALDHR
jgi:hypothetical protein